MGRGILLYFQHDTCLSSQDPSKGFRTSQIGPCWNKPQNLQGKQDSIPIEFPRLSTSYFIIPGQGAVDHPGQTLLDASGELVPRGVVARNFSSVQILLFDHLYCEAKVACVGQLLLIDCYILQRQCQRIDCGEKEVWIVEKEVVVCRD